MGEQLTVWGVLNVVVELAVAPHLGEEEGDSGHTDPGEGAQRVGDLPTHLVLRGWGEGSGREASVEEGVPGAGQRPKSPNALALCETGRAGAEAPVDLWQRRFATLPALQRAAHLGRAVLRAGLVPGLACCASGTCFWSGMTKGSLPAGTRELPGAVSATGQAAIDL